MCDSSVLYIPIENDGGYFGTTVEGFIILFIHEWSGSHLRVVFVKDCPKKSSVFLFQIKKAPSEIMSWKSLPWKARLTTLPFVTVGETSEMAEVIISGLAAVSRCIVKLCPMKEVHQVLGFRQNCLQASSETSIWTHFCEVAMPRAIEQFEESSNFPHFKVPTPVAQFEEHLKQPVRMHNVVKRWQNDTGSTEGTETKQVQKMIPFWISHTFAEGPDMTLADLILFPCIQLVVKEAGAKNVLLKTCLPYTLEWHSKMIAKIRVVSSWNRVIDDAFNLAAMESRIKNDEISVVVPRVAQESLYKKDTSRVAKEDHCDEHLGSAVSQLKSRQLFAEDASFFEHLDADLRKLLRVDIDKGGEYMEHIAWELLPAQAHPRLGQVPGSRLSRKMQQLDNMAHTVMINAKEGDVIVEFCSGSGHLGVVLAYLLPKCRLVLVDNKEESVLRARKRAAALCLTNITLIQSNLDYFCAEFSVGVALHACGVATDLVLRTCFAQRASFILCPCCYGNLAANLPVDYPQSCLFAGRVSPSCFFCISKAADDVTPTGKACMNSVDLDRAVRAAELNYHVVLSKLKPESCTPKHNLLIGVPVEKLSS